MPIYIYEHPKTGERREVFQKMNDIHEYSDGGVKWQRVLIPVNTSVPLAIDPFSSQDFVKKSREKNMTVGDMWDESAKLSEKRKRAKGSKGIDIVKAKAAYNYQKKTGIRHPQYKP